MRTAILITWLLLAGVQAQTPVKLFTHYDGAELVGAFPELAGMQFPAGQTELGPALRTAGASVNQMLAGLPAVSAAERIRELRFDRGGGVMGRTEDFRYVARYAIRGAETVLDEYRIVPETGTPATPPTASDFLVLGHFEALLNYFRPENGGHSDFHYAGRLSENGTDVAVIAFAQHPESNLRSHVVAGDGGRTARIHGLAWIDAVSGRVLRLHVELAEQIANFPFETLSTDVVFTPVAFGAVDADSWLPARATVHGRYAGGEVHTVHRFTDYRLMEKADSPDGVAGKAADADASDDSFEVLARGIQLVDSHKLEEAVAAMRESVRLDAESSFARFYLAAALSSTGDLGGAEEQVREGLKRRPNDGPAHNFLAVVLSKRGDLPAASDEFRASAELQPKNAVVHANLGQILEKLGKADDAIAAYRAASALEPDNNGYRTHLERLESRAGTGADTPLRVEVRQVLVPVIATDGAGHHVTGLKQADFRVFEDGVEQKITSFSSESAGAAAISGAGPESTAANDSTAERSAIRRTYVICIDTLHTAITGLVNARAAIEKLLQGERQGDAQYVLVAVGSTAEILENTTRDPSLLVKALDERKFQRRLLDSRRGSTEVDLSRFIRSLDDARRACDAGSPSCGSLKRMLPTQADQIAVQERVYNLVFLRQLRNIVEQLSHGNDRRTLVLISDGFDLVPGKAARTLLYSYFQEFRFAALGSVDRMQEEFNQVVRLASRSNITIHTLNTRGLYTRSYFEASNAGSGGAMMPAVLSAMNQGASDLQSALSEIAAATGGIAFKNNNDLLLGLKRAFAYGREYYMLGYVSGNSNMDGTFRKISVQTRDRKLALHAKKGYWAIEK